jgi:chloramphenicol-sensitive protein RarD
MPPAQEAAQPSNAVTVSAPLATDAGAPRAHGRGRGLAAGATAFIVWGLFPLYLAGLRDVPVLQVIAHRIVWCCVIVFALVLARGELGKLRAALSDPAIATRLLTTATLVSVNWVVYVWGVGHGHVVETSLGYFINPLLNVLLGVVVLSERLNRAQWIAVSLAAVAVAYLTVAAGAVPWIALTLATSFALYGLLRKIVPVEALVGLAAETLILLPVSAGWLIWCEATGTGTFGHSGRLTDVLLLGSGAATALPLFLFSYGARLIPYSTVGLLQYIAPSLQLACGVLVFHEPFTRTRAAGFALIWTALLIYAADGLMRARRAAARRTR